MSAPNPTPATKRESLRARIAQLKSELDAAYLEERLDKPPRIRVALALIALKETPQLLDALDAAEAKLRQAKAVIASLQFCDGGHVPGGCPQVGRVGSVDPLGGE